MDTGTAHKVGLKDRSGNGETRRDGTRITPASSAGLQILPGYLRLGKSYGDKRLEAACRLALTLGCYSYQSIESILKKRLDEQPLEIPQELELSVTHDNIRGPDYYN